MTRERDVREEDAPEAAERGGSFLQPRAGRLQEAHHGHAVAARQREDLEDRLRFGLARRAAAETRVLGIGGDRSPGHLAGRRDDGDGPVAVELGEEVEGPWIEERREAAHRVQPGRFRPRDGGRHAGRHLTASVDIARRESCRKRVIREWMAFGRCW